MGAAVGVMVADYFFVTRGNNFLQYLYDGDRKNPHYYYHRGWNVQAYIAYVCGVVIPFPGFCGSLGANVSQTALNIGHIGWCLSFSVAIIVYVPLCYVWPTSNQKAMKGMNLRFEQMADELFEGHPLRYDDSDQLDEIGVTEVTTDEKGLAAGLKSTL